MQLLPLEKLGPREVEGQCAVVLVGLFLLWVFAVQETDRITRSFTNRTNSSIQPLKFELSQGTNPAPSHGRPSDLRIDNHRYRW